MCTFFLEGSGDDKTVICHRLLAWSKPSKSNPDVEMTAQVEETVGRGS